jgi:hypothetical protein
MDHLFGVIVSNGHGVRVGIEVNDIFDLLLRLCAADQKVFKVILHNIAQKQRALDTKPATRCS